MPAYLEPQWPDWWFGVRDSLKTVVRVPGFRSRFPSSELALRNRQRDNIRHVCIKYSFSCI